MKQKINQINSGFKIPKNYFESFSKRLEDELQAIIFKKQITNRTVFLVPERYFETFENRILTKLEPKQTLVFSLKINKYLVSGIAALFLAAIMFPVFYHTEEIKETHEAAKDYLEIHADELSTYEVGVLLQDSEIEDLENELIYNNI